MKLVNSLAVAVVGFFWGAALLGGEAALEAAVLHAKTADLFTVAMPLRIVVAAIIGQTVAIYNMTTPKE